MELPKAELVDDGAKHDRKGRRIMPGDHIAGLVREFEGSGLTLAAVARRASLNYSTFAGWVYKQRASVNPKAPRMRFAQLQLPAPSVAPADLSVTLPDGVVLRGRDSQGIAALVRALRS